MRSTRHIASCLLFLSVVPVTTAHAGMGNRGAAPVYHPEPCRGDACNADDSRSGQPCQGLLCSFSSAKALQPPVTAAQAAEARQKAMAETIKPIETVAPAAKTAAAKRKRVKHVARTDVPVEGAKSPTNETSATAR